MVVHGSSRRSILKGGSLRRLFTDSPWDNFHFERALSLGLQAGTARQFQIWGLNLGDTTAAMPEPFGLMAGKTMDVGAISATTRNGETANLLPVAIGPYNEFEETGSNHSVQSAQELGFPVTVNGRILLDSSGHALPDFYRFAAKKGQKLILETTASRLGSPLTRSSKYSTPVEIWFRASLRDLSGRHKSPSSTENRSLRAAPGSDE